MPRPGMPQQRYETWNPYVSPGGQLHPQGGGQGGQGQGQGQMLNQPGMVQTMAPTGPPMTQAEMDAAKPMPLGHVEVGPQQGQWGGMGGFGGPMGGFGGPMGGYGMGGYPPQAMGGLLGGMQGGCPPWMPGCGGGYGGGGGYGMQPLYGGARTQLPAQAPTQQQPPPPPGGGGGTTVGYSDEQLKTDIKPMEDGLELVLRINPVRFRWNEGDELPAAGMIAQQVEEVFPEAVVDMGDGYKGIDSLAVIGALVGAVQTLTARLEALEAK